MTERLRLAALGTGAPLEHVAAERAGGQIDLLEDAP